MKYIKYLICSLVLAVLALGTGEMYRIASVEFPIGSQITVRLTRSEKSADFFDCAQQAAQNAGVSAFYRSLMAKDYSENETIAVYCSDESAKRILTDDFGLKEGRVRSVFLGSAEIRYDELRNCGDEATDITLFVAGSEEAQRLFADTVGEKYRIESNNLYEEHTEAGDEKFIRFQAIAWAIACAFVICIGLYETAMNKKAVAVRYTHGERLSGLYGKKVLADSTAFSAVFAVLVAVLTLFTNPLYSFKVTLVGFAAFLLANAVSQLPMLGTDIRRAFASDTRAKGLLAFSYAVKFAFCFVAAVVGGVCFSLIGKSLDAEANRAFFESHKDYRYIEMAREEIADLGEQMNDSAKLTYKLTQACEDVLLQAVYSEYEGSDRKKHDVVVCGKSSIDYIASVMPDALAEPLNDGKMYVFVPDYKGADGDSSRYISLAYPSDGGAGYYFAGDYSEKDVQTVKYKKGVEFQTVDSSGIGKLSRDPVIIYSTVSGELDLSQFEIKHIDEHMTSGGLRMPNYTVLQSYKISDDALAKFAAENDFDLNNDIFYSESIYDKYSYEAQNINRYSIVAAVCLAVIMAVELLLVGTLVRLEYTVNAKKMAIKKVLGYSLIQRNRPMILGTAAIYAAVTAAVSAVNGFLELTDPAFVLLGCLMCVTVELLFTVRYIIRTERVKTVKVLKGGAL